MCDIYGDVFARRGSNIYYICVDVLNEPAKLFFIIYMAIYNVGCKHYIQARVPDAVVVQCPLLNMTPRPANTSVVELCGVKRLFDHRKSGEVTVGIWFFLSTSCPLASPDAETLSWCVPSHYMVKMARTTSPALHTSMCTVHSGAVRVSWLRLISAICYGVSGKKGLLRITGIPRARGMPWGAC